MPIGSNSAPKRGIENVFVTGFEKRRKPRKHYVRVRLTTINFSPNTHKSFQLSRAATEMNACSFILGLRDRGIVDGSQQIRDLQEVQRLLLIPGNVATYE